MKIENEYGGGGTGFLVFRPIVTGSKEGNGLLISNKHVLNKNSELRNKSFLNLLAIHHYHFTSI